jgi:hypothetical protein
MDPDLANCFYEGICKHTCSIQQGRYIGMNSNAHFQSPKFDETRSAMDGDAFN